MDSEEYARRLRHMEGIVADLEGRVAALEAESAGVSAGDARAEDESGETLPAAPAGSEFLARAAAGCFARRGALV
ncbi:MAG: hypothetical protein HZA54_20815, partial [Planctomycetes bacterium]|nr:hypothetical protein [Planctomycetota bacterium]